MPPVCAACHRPLDHRIGHNGGEINSTVLTRPDGTTAITDTCSGTCMRTLLAHGYTWPTRAQLGAFFTAARAARINAAPRTRVSA